MAGKARDFRMARCFRVDALKEWKIVGWVSFTNPALLLGHCVCWVGGANPAYGLGRRQVVGSALNGLLGHAALHKSLGVSENWWRTMRVDVFVALSGKQ